MACVWCFSGWFVFVPFNLNGVSVLMARARTPYMACAVFGGSPMLHSQACCLYAVTVITPHVQPCRMLPGMCMQAVFVCSRSLLLTAVGGNLDTCSTLCVGATVTVPAVLRLCLHWGLGGAFQIES